MSTIYLQYYTDQYNKNSIAFPSSLPNTDPDDISNFINDISNEFTLCYDNYNIKYIFYKRNADLCITIIANNINVSQIYITLVEKNMLLLLDFLNTITNNYINNLENSMNILSIQSN